MRRLLILLLLVLAMPLPASGAEAAPASQTLHSTLLGEQRSYRVILPDSYYWAASRRYPVLYLLDGQTHVTHTAASLGFLTQQGEIPELIIVSIDSTVRIRDFTQTDWASHWVGGGGADRFADFLQRELIPLIEREYRTAPFRILSGHSASGQFALHMLATRPALFNAVLAMAPSLDWDEGLPTRELETQLARAGRPSRFVYFAYGDDAKAALAADLRLVQTLQAHGKGTLRVAVGAHPQERHSAIPLLANIEGMRALYAGYQLPNADTPPTLAMVQANADALGAKLGLAMPVPESALIELAYGLLESGEIAQATAVFERATRENPESSNAWDSLADAYAAAEKWQKALEVEQRALTLGKRFGTGDTEHYQRQINKYRAKQPTH